MNLTKFFFISLFCGIFTLQAESIPFNKADFEKAKLENKSIVLDVYAWWCPLCNMQESRLTSIIADEKDMTGYIVFTIKNSDSETKKEFNVQSRGTLIVFKGNLEKARLVLDADKDKIRDLLKTGL